MTRALLLTALVLGAAALLYQGWDMVFRSPPRLILQGNDDSFYYFWVRSAVVDRDLDFDNDLRNAPTLDESARQRALAEPRTALGLVRNKYPLGWALVTLPFFLIAHAIASVTGGPADGWQPIYFVVIWLGHLGCTAVGVLAARRVLARFMSTEAANVGVLAGWLCSPLLYYQSVRLGMPHGLCFTLVALLYDRALACADAPARRQTWLIIGAAAGLLLITRPICAPYLLFPAIMVGRLLWSRDTRSTALRQLSWAVLPALGFMAIYLLAQRQLHGAWRLDTYDSEPFYFAHPRVLASLFSPLHGWFYWHPLLAAGVGAFILAVLRRKLPASWLVALVLVTYINASWWCWWWGSSFGNRSFEAATLFAMAGWGLIWSSGQAASALRRVAVIVIFLGVVANALLLALFMNGAINRGDAVTYADMAAALLKWIGLAAHVSGS